LSGDYSYAYCDGGKTKSAVVYKWHGATKSLVVPNSIGATNDCTEAVAILRACEHAEKAGGNWIVITDSRAALNKIDGGTNATGEPSINGIKRILERVNGSHGPNSIQLRWMKRRGTQEMIMADELCREK